MKNCCGRTRSQRRRTKVTNTALTINYCCAFTPKMSGFVSGRTQAVRKLFPPHSPSFLSCFLPRLFGSLLLSSFSSHMFPPRRLLAERVHFPRASASDGGGECNRACSIMGAETAPLAQPHLRSVLTRQRFRLPKKC